MAISVTNFVNKTGLSNNDKRALTLMLTGLLADVAALRTANNLLAQKLDAAGVAGNYVATVAIPAANVQVVK